MGMLEGTKFLLQVAQAVLALCYITPISTVKVISHPPDLLSFRIYVATFRAHPHNAG